MHNARNVSPTDPNPMDDIYIYIYGSWVYSPTAYVVVKFGISQPDRILDLFLQLYERRFDKYPKKR